ncbi:MAG: PQQ-binding-like beta-propeller repeat protein [Phycisphaerales bacterium]|nr:PQQ-binding-like beta-propeller repeat protein [Phycisphaerales bacterium]MCI0677051.1 PQQ-binding-like beta-propeller repeat protein [Phycisphaerales bacterium]
MLRSALRSILIILVIGCFAPRTLAQPENPVYVDDSPQAWELFRHAQDQVRHNAGEAVRLYQELLDDFALKLIPVAEGEAARDHFTAVRRRVVQALRRDPALLERYRSIQTPAAERLLQSNELERLAMTRSLTAPGLEALLRLAQRELEAARFRQANWWLSQAIEHPDLDDRKAGHCHFMLGLAGHYLGEPDQVQLSLEALSGLGPEAAQFHAQLARLSESKATAAHGPALSGLDRGQGSDLDDLVAQAIWSVPLEDSLSRRRFAAIQDDPVDIDRLAEGIEQRLIDADLTTAVATVDQSTVYVNQGYTILALNRLTGRELWRYPKMNRLGLPDRDIQNALDLNVVAAAEGSVVTLTGHAVPSGRTEDGQIVCLDPRTGLDRWPPVSFNRVIDGGPDEDLFPHGAPIIAEGLIFVAARKVSRQLLTSMYVVALNLQDGKVRWWRHITSSGGLQARTRPFCTMLYDRGGLYVSSAVGATARLEAATGEMHWLQRFNVPITPPILDQNRRPWEMTGPVMTSRGLVAVQPDQRWIMLLDIDTGDVLDRQSSSSNAGWNSPRYLLADEDYVYGIGSEIRAFRHDDLVNPVWRLPGPPQEDENRQPLSPTSIEIRGRVQLADGSLIVPATDGVMVVDRETGNVRSTLAVQPVGNPVATEAQLLLACGDRLDSYMSFNKAQQMLRDRIAHGPDEPEPALSLLRLGMRVRNLELALEAAQLAINAINRMSQTNAADRRPAEARGELFALLLDLARENIARTQSEGELLYATIGSVAIEPAHRVDYLLAYGDWLVDHSLGKAVESYQAILSDRALAAAWRDAEGTARPASAWAGQRLAKLIAERGSAIYAPQADYAASRLRQIIASETPPGTPAGNSPAPQPRAPAIDPDELVALAQEFPFADASTEAALAASEIYLKRGQPRPAIAALMTAYHAAPRKKTAPRLLGAFVSICMNQQWTMQARDALRHVISTYGDLPLVGAAGEQRPSVWLKTLESAADQTARLATIGEPNGEALPLAGSVVPPDPACAMPPDRVLLRNGQQFQLLNSRQMGEPIWSSTVPGEGARILRFDDRGILVWFGADAQEPKAVMLDPVDGKVRWTTPRVATVLGETPRPSGRWRGGQDQMADGEPFDPTQTLPRLDARSLFMIQRTGGVIAIELADPARAGRVRWHKPPKATLEQIHVVALNDAALALAGMTRDLQAADESTGGMAPRLLVLDPQTGQPLYDQTQLGPIGRNGVTWMTISPLGLLTYGADEGVSVFDLYGGQRRWSSSPYTVVNTQRAWRFDDLIVLEDQRSRLRTVQLHDATISDPFEAPLRGEWDPPALNNVMLIGDKIVAHYPQRVVMYEPLSGAVVGVDIITDDRDYRWLLPALNAQGENRLLVVNARSSQVAVGGGPGMRNQYKYWLYLLSDNGKVLADPAEAPPLGDKVQQARLIDGWLLLSTQSNTLAIPMPAQ